MQTMHITSTNIALRKGTCSRLEGVGGDDGHEDGLLNFF